MQVIEWFGRLLAPRALAVERRSRPRWLTILAYHRVTPAPGASFPFDRDVLDCEPHVFDQHMEVLEQTCTPVTLDQVLAFLAGEPLPPNPVLVTFDDGYRDNRDHALPILLRRKVPAVFFVATSFVQERRAFWWDRIAYLFHHTEVSVARLSYPTQFVLRPRTEPARARRTALRLIKSYPGLDIERFLGELGRALRVPWDRELEREVAEQLVMTWEHVRDLVDAGMEVGSHTCSHRVLHTVPHEALPAELRESRDVLQRITGREVRSISYPVGRPLRKMPALMRAVRDAGYQVGFSAEPRANPIGAELDPFDLARLQVDTRMTRDHLRAFLAAPELCRAW